MVATERAYNRATRRAERWLRETGEEFRHARISAGLSQQEVADRVRISRSVYSRIERGKLRHLSILLATRIAMVLGLDLAVRAYPGGLSIRDAAHAERLKRVLSRVEPPLSYRIEVPLPQREGSPEQRAWDSMIFGRGQQTAVELEMRLYDVQAQTRRVFLKWRDGRPDQLLLVIADTRANRRIINEFGDLFTDLPRLRTANVLKMLSAGEHPPSGYVLV